MGFTVEPEFAATSAAFLNLRPASSPAVGDVQTRRQDFLSHFKPLLDTQFPRISTIHSRDYRAISVDGHRVPLRWYFKSGSSPGSAILFIHSGGLILGDTPTFDGLVNEYVDKSGVPFLSVEYRLAPEHKYPKALEDVFAGLVWLHTHAAELGVDPNRIGIHGESAGGGLAAALAIHARDMQGPAIAKQILIYPMLDDRNIRADRNMEQFLVWSAADNETGWNAYLGENKRGSARVPPTAAAARLEDAKNLPPLYIEVGVLDLFRDEAIEHMKKHLQAGVTVEFHLWPGVPHGFEWFSPKGRIASASMKAREQAARSI
jgi:acetyl esterase/lipase